MNCFLSSSAEICRKCWTLMTIAIRIINRALVGKWLAIHFIGPSPGGFECSRSGIKQGIKRGVYVVKEGPILQVRIKGESRYEKSETCSQLPIKRRHKRPPEIVARKVSAHERGFWERLWSTHLLRIKKTLAFRKKLKPELFKQALSLLMF